MYNNDNDAEFLFNQDIREKKRARSGLYGKIQAKITRKYGFNPAAHASEMKPNDMLIRRADGVQAIIPANWFTKTGKIKKGRVKEYKALLQVPDPVIVPVKTKTPGKRGRKPIPDDVKVERLLGLIGKVLDTLSDEYGIDVVTKVVLDRMAEEE